MLEDTWRLDADDATSVHKWVQGHSELVLYYQPQDGEQVISTDFTLAGAPI